MCVLQLEELAKADDSLQEGWGKYLHLCCKKVPEDNFRAFQRDSFDLVNRYLPPDTAPPPPATFVPPPVQPQQQPLQQQQQPALFDLGGLLGPTGSTPPLQQLFRRTPTTTQTTGANGGPSGVIMVGSESTIKHSQRNFVYK